MIVDRDTGNLMWVYYAILNTYVKSIISQEPNTTGDYIDKGFFWDYVKMRIWTETITFSKQLKQKEQKLQKDLQRTLDILKSEHLIAPTTDKLEQINSIKKELENIQLIVTNEAMIRAKAQNIEGGEKNSKYFSALEKIMPSKNLFTS